MTWLFSSATAPVDERADRDPPHDHDHRQHVERLDQPVAGVRERHGHHSFAAESRYRPSVVKQTMTASIQYCEFVALRGSR